MANDYYSGTTKVTRQTLARSTIINGIFDNIAAGFAKLPSENALIQDRITYASDTGAADAYVMALPKTLTAYTAGMSVRVNILNTNTGASTINVDSLGAKAIKRIDGTDVEATDLTAGDIHQFVYSGVNFVMVTPSRTHMTGIAANLAANLVFSGDVTFSGNPVFTGSPNFSSATNKSTIRADIGLAIGTNVQAYDVELAAIAGLTSTADGLPYFTGSGTAALATFTTAGRALLDDATASDQRTTLGVAIGTNVQAHSAVLDDLNALGANAADGEFLVGSGAGTLVWESGATARTSLGVAIGTDVQAYDADLTVFGDNPLDAAELGELQNIGTTTISAAQWGYVGGASASFLSAQETKINYITVTQAVDLDAMETRVNALDAAVILQGSWDASVGTFPGSGTAQAGDSWIVSTGGTVNGVVFVADDRIIAILDNASTATFAANWHKADYTDLVTSVGGNTGVISDAQILASVKAADAELSALSDLVSAADGLPYFTGSGTAALATFTTAGRALLDDATASDQRTTLGLAIGTDVQAYDADLTVFGNNPLDAAELSQLQNIGTDTISVAQWGYVGGADQAVKTTDNVTFGAINATSISFDGGTNSLADYEEGTFTPSMTDGTNSDATFSTVSGEYTKIGDTVFCNMRLVTSSLGTLSGDLSITGLPFTSSATTTAIPVGRLKNMNISAGEHMAGFVKSSSTEVALVKTGATAAGSTNFQDTEWSADGDAMISFSYKTS